MGHTLSREIPQAGSVVQHWEKNAGEYVTQNSDMRGTSSSCCLALLAGRAGATCTAAQQ